MDQNLKILLVVLIFICLCSSSIISYFVISSDEDKKDNITEKTKETEKEVEEETEEEVEEETEEETAEEVEETEEEVEEETEETEFENEDEIINYLHDPQGLESLTKENIQRLHARGRGLIPRSPDPKCESGFSCSNDNECSNDWRSVNGCYIGVRGHAGNNGRIKNGYYFKWLYENYYLIHHVNTNSFLSINNENIPVLITNNEIANKLDNLTYGDIKTIPKKQILIIDRLNDNTIYIYSHDDLKKKILFQIYNSSFNWSEDHDKYYHNSQEEIVSLPDNRKEFNLSNHT